MQLLITTLLVSSALASGGRSLPSGAADPAVVENIFSSSAGEVHIVTRKAGSSAILRLESGALLELSGLSGPAVCGDWLENSRSGALPRGCDFHFQNEHGSRKVRSEDLEETSLFQAVRGTVRGKARGDLVSL